jgi:hypothetical protein
VAGVTLRQQAVKDAPRVAGTGTLSLFRWSELPEFRDTYP